MVGLYIFALPSLPSDEDLQVLEEKIHYSFANDALLREALQVPSGFNGDGNKRLALIGIKIIGLNLASSGRNKNKTIGKRFTLAISLYFIPWTYALIRRNHQNDQRTGRQCPSRQAGICPRH